MITRVRVARPPLGRSRGNAACRRRGGLAGASGMTGRGVGRGRRPGQREPGARGRGTGWSAAPARALSASACSCSSRAFLGNVSAIAWRVPFRWYASRAPRPAPAMSTAPCRRHPSPDPDHTSFLIHVESPRLCGGDRPRAPRPVDRRDASRGRSARAWHRVPGAADASSRSSSSGVAMRVSARTFRIRQLAPRERIRQPRQGAERTRHAHVLARRAHLLPTRQLSHWAQELKPWFQPARGRRNSRSAVDAGLARGGVEWADSSCDSSPRSLQLRHRFRSRDERAGADIHWCSPLADGRLYTWVWADLEASRARDFVTII